MDLDEARKAAMHSAAERARLRRQQEEEEREKERERARKKAAELEARMKTAEEEKMKQKAAEVEVRSMKSFTACVLTCVTGGGSHRGRSAVSGTGASRRGSTGEDYDCRGISFNTSASRPKSIVWPRAIVEGLRASPARTPAIYTRPYVTCYGS